MSVQRVQFSSFDHPFEEHAFHTLANQLELLRGDFTVCSPFQAGSSQIDGLIISQTCVFTLEYKAMRGRVERGMNTPTRVYDDNGRAIDLSNRYEDPYVQAGNQWKPLRDLFRDSFGVDDIFIKSALVFDSGTSFQVPADNRDFSNAFTPAFILNLDEVPLLVQTFQPPRCRFLDSEAQAALVQAIAQGPARVTPAQKRAVTSSRIISPVVETTAESSPFSGRPDDNRVPISFPRPEILGAAGTSSDEPESVSLTAVSRPDWGRVVRRAVLLALAFVLFALGGDWVGATVLTLILFGVMQMGSAWRTGYVFVGGLVFTAARMLWSLGLGLAVVTAVVWPIGAPLAYFRDDVAPLVEEFFEEAREAVDETTVPQPTLDADAPEAIQEDAGTATPPPVDDATPQVEVIGNSNVRAGPGTDNAVVGLVLAEETYAILDESEDGAWFQIRLENGTLGWIGSSRVRELP